MKNMKKMFTYLLISAAVLLVAPAAYAGKSKAKNVSRTLSSSEFQIPKVFCESGVVIDKKADGCEDNEYYTKAAESCLEKLDSETDRVIAYHTPPGVEPKEYTDSTSLKGVSIEGFGYLLTLNELAKGEIKEYLQHLRFPEDADDDEVAGGDSEQHASEVPCYGEAKDDINGTLEDIEADILIFSNYQAHAAPYASQEGHTAIEPDTESAPVEHTEQRDHQ